MNCEILSEEKHQSKEDIILMKYKNNRIIVLITAGQKRITHQHLAISLFPTFAKLPNDKFGHKVTGEIVSILLKS